MPDATASLRIAKFFADSADMITLRNFTYGDTPEPDAVAALTRHILGQEDCFDVSFYELSGGI